MNFMKAIKNVMSPHQRRRKSLKIYVKKGQSVLDTNLMTSRSDEEEVILPANTHLYIIKRENNTIICGVLDDTSQEG